jgi:glycosyltransferase involved in cell wall biosynthesis
VQQLTKSYKMSVIIPCFNHGEFLPEAVDSVNSINRNDVELIVVDDGSTDERTGREMDVLSGRGITVIRQANRGLAAARNSGILASQGEYILPLDADDRLRSGWIERGIGLLDASPQVGVVYGDAQCFGKRVDHWPVGPFEPDRLLNWNFIHACALYRRSVWEQNRGYDGTMPVQGLEDWDFWLGAFEHGWRFVYLPEVFFDYRQSEGSMITQTAAFTNQIREFIEKKHGRLYGQAWRSLVKERESLISERESVRWTFKNLRRLLRLKLKAKLRVSNL